MPKEMIVSVNGREKKIAIIENGRVTEFYIERGESSQGIVGNIYKGRVMRVLPGMQSAFVDIGLERDTFLYVSDFFDEEEEFERIVMDKSKKGDQSAAEKAAHEQIEKSRVEREYRIEAAHERVEPLLDSEPMAGEEEEEQEEEEQQPEAVAAAQEQPAPEMEADGKRRGRRGRRRGKSGAAGPEDVRAETPAQPQELEGVQTPFVAATGSFERVVDEDELNAANGEMFKDA